MEEMHQSNPTVRTPQETVSCKTPRETVSRKRTRAQSDGAPVESRETISQKRTRTQSNGVPVESLETISQKRTRAHINELLAEKGAEEGHKRTRLHELDDTREDRLEQSKDGASEQDLDPVAYWTQYHRWPREYFTECECDDMANILARKRSTIASSKKSSQVDAMTVPSVTPSDQQPREEKSADYKTSRYDVVLATKGSFMEASELGVAELSATFCEELLAKDQTVPRDSLFQDDLFEKACKMVEGRNEAKIVQDMTRLIVPSAEDLALRGTLQLKGLIESVNEGWNNSIPVTKTRPQPDYAVGFRRKAFTQAQLDRMQPFIGGVMDQSFFMATYYMYFPFLTCEVKCGIGGLDVADRQNAHSMTIAVRAVMELFRLVKRDKELHRQILAFSISHDHETVRIYGHYAEVDGPELKYYRHKIRKFDFTDLHGKEKWTTYKFIRNVYDVWAPMHFQRICSAIDEIPANVSFAMSESDLHFTESSGLSQDVGRANIASSSAGTQSARAQGDNAASVAGSPASTPDTSMTGGGAFKRPRRERDQ